MPKQVSQSKMTEWKGLERLNEECHALDCIFREQIRDDYGIDGEIELMTRNSDGTSFSASGRIVKVQLKSGRSYVTRDSPEAFSTPVRLADLEYWHNFSYPIILVVYNPNDDVVYWKDLKAYLSKDLTSWRSPHVVTFSKEFDKFNSSSRLSLSAVAGERPNRVDFATEERLYSNLFPILSLPTFATRAKCKFQGSDSLERMMSAHRGTFPPFLLKNGLITTTSDLRSVTNPLKTFCVPRTTEDIDLRGWSQDEDSKRDYVFLLNRVLEQHTRALSLRVNRKLNRIYFPVGDLSKQEGKVEWRSQRTGHSSSRLVYKFYTYGGISFWRHLAATFHFVSYGDDWFLQIIPRYLFTSDGITLLDRDVTGPYTTRMRSMERNHHFLNQVLFWASFLANGSPTIDLLTGKTASVRIDVLPATVVAHFGIVQDSTPFDSHANGDAQLNLFDDFDLEDLADDVRN